MGKRSNFERIPRDKYMTPKPGLTPLIPHLPRHQHILEPCAGDGNFGRMLSAATGSSITMYDIEPDHPEYVTKQDCFDIDKSIRYAVDIVVTNPPWERVFLHKFIQRFVVEYKLPCWLLFDADWKYTKQAKPYLYYLYKQVVVGRLVWIPGTKHASKDNCVWYYFAPEINKTRQIEFHGKE